MKIRPTKKEKIEKKRKKLRRLTVRLLKTKPDAGDILDCLGNISDEKVQGVINKLFLRVSSIDDLFCAMRFTNKHYQRLLWDKIKQKAHKDQFQRNHSKIILLQIAEEMPDFTALAITEIEQLGLKLSYEETSRLLDLRNIQFNDQLAKKLRKARREQFEKIQRVHDLVEEIKKIDRELKELRRN